MVVVPEARVPLGVHEALERCDSARGDERLHGPLLLGLPLCVELPVLGGQPVVLCQQERIAGCVKLAKHSERGL